jgi:hypothetical protein
MTPPGAPTLFVIPRDAALRRETMRGARRWTQLSELLCNRMLIKRYPCEDPATNDAVQSEAKRKTGGVEDQ